MEQFAESSYAQSFPPFPQAEKSEHAPLPREIEVKLISLADQGARFLSPEFRQQITALGGVEIGGGWRRLSDVRFSLDPRLVNRKNRTCTVPLGAFADLASAQQALEYLGVSLPPVLASQDKNVAGNIKNALPARKVRLRTEESTGAVTLTVKEDVENKTSSVVDRVEVSAPVSNPEQLRNFLESVGYKLTSERQKSRCTYQLDDGLVELNLAPDDRIPVWVEVEAPNQERVLEIVNVLGVEKTAISTRSDSQYFLQCGLDKQAIKKMKF